MAENSSPISLDKIFIDRHCDKSSLGHNYSPGYEKWFKPFKNYPLTIIELGIGGYEHPDRGGQSLRAWKDYFVFSTIHGIDMYDKKPLEEDRIFTHQAMQDDHVKLGEIIKETGRPHIIIDDASHHSDLTMNSFWILFPLLQKGGFYCIEDTHTSYWDRIASTGEDFGGGVHPNTMLNHMKELTDTLNWEEAQRLLPVSNNGIESISFYKGLVIIQKQ